MKYWSNAKSAEPKEWEGGVRPGKTRKLSLYNEFVMALMRMRLDLPLLLIADLFSVSTTKVTEVTITWIALMHQVLFPALVYMPAQQQVRQRAPKQFRKYYPKTRAVVDCSEFFTDRPHNKEEQYRTYSSYKSHNTDKCFIAVTPNGAFCFISDLWSGNVSDKYITEHSGFVELLEGGDEIMADRGFRIEDLLLMRGATLVAPPFTRSYNGKKGKGKRLNVKEIRKTQVIARLRIHVERAIQACFCLLICMYPLL